MVVSLYLRSVALGMLLVSAAPAFADYVVDTDSDLDNASDGLCSLREAIIAVNSQANYNECVSANAGESTVSFGIPPGLDEVHVIGLTSALPTITHTIVIDGTTQPGTLCTPVPNARIQIANPSSLPIDGLVLEVQSTLSDIRGISLAGFAATQSAGLRIYSDDARIGCILSGTNASGTVAQPNWYGVYIDGQAAVLGVATSTEWLPNLISGNSQANVFVNAGGVNTVIAGNYIGVDSSGASALPSAFGIYSYHVNGLRIGYAAGDAPAARQRNVIGLVSQPETTSISILLDNSSDNVIAGNYIGVSADGQIALPIGTGIAVSVFQSTSTVIGCDGNEPSADCRNVIANPGGTAVQNFEGSASSAVVGNYIGVSADRATAFGGSSNTYGIAMTGADTLVSRNLITTGAQGSGIVLSPSSAKQTPLFLNQTMAGSTGAVLDSSGNCLQGNGGGGVSVSTGSNPTVNSTDFTGNWWGASDGPAPNGSGDSVANNVIYTPFLSAPANICAADLIFASGFEL